MTTAHGTSTANHLLHETSPYLLQHAHNPVEWYPWGPDALERARQEDRPILLSIGYSACHWCHVMAHESFEDSETAALMNRLFVNIKVDREERPDLDKVHQTAHQLLTQRPGGWPLTVFLTPDDRIPFFAGTYFPGEPRHGLPGFKDLLQRVAAFYPTHREEIRRQNDSLRDALTALTGAGASQDSATLTPAPLAVARQQLEHSYDERYGGFGAAPKFPHPTSIEYLLRRWADARDSGHEDTRAREMAASTLRNMARGGLYDQIGGGFCRYSVDERWMIPHFEKMLYDNGPLLALYSQAWHATGEPLFQRVAQETAAWVMREMQSPEGGYYSTLDADSEGEEGRYYVWDRDTLQARLDEPVYRVCAARFGLDQPPNFEGRWHLNVHRDLAATARAVGIPEDEAARLLAAAREQLHAIRAERVRPGRDEKILTSWNALMIKGMAIAARHLGDPEWVRSAERALEFLRTTLWQDGRLLATYKDGRAHLNAYLDDYAFLLDAILELLQVRWCDADLAFARDLAEALLARFEDRNTGGFFFTSNDHEPLIQRPKPLGDDSTPSGNGVAAYALNRLGHLLAEPRYLEAAERTLKAAYPALQQVPYAHISLLIALDESLRPPQVVVLRGAAEALPQWWAHAAGPYAPHRMTLAIPGDAQTAAGVLGQPPAADGVIAYICTGTACGPPVTSLEDLEPALRRARPG
ncbi:MAG: thioredoxin domain-containing protein [Gammaproteobacteria bacterium]